MYKRCLSAGTHHCDFRKISMTFVSFELVFVMAITSLCLLHTYGHAEITLSLADTVLQCILDCLVRIQTSIRPQADQPIRLESKMENPAVDDMSYNYNLSEYEERCPQHRYTIRMIERRPMVVYIEQFLTANEMTHLIELSYVLSNTSWYHYLTSSRVGIRYLDHHWFSMMQGQLSTTSIEHRTRRRSNADKVLSWSA